MEWNTGYGENIDNRTLWHRKAGSYGGEHLPLRGGLGVTDREDPRVRSTFVDRASVRSAFMIDRTPCRRYPRPNPRRAPTKWQRRFRGA